ncbi:MAG: hypothetical protein VW518_03330, partial [Burkholderiaceae bacterium]
QDMTLDQQKDFLEYEIERKEAAIEYLQELLDSEMKTQAWQMKKLTELKDDDYQSRIRLVASISGGPAND